MKESKIGNIAAPVSIILGIVGTGTMHIGFAIFGFPVFVGFPLAIIGMLFGYASCGYANRKLTILGIFLNNFGIWRLASILILMSGRYEEINFKVIF